MNSRALAVFFTLFLPSVLSAQIIGGKWIKEHRFSGINPWDMLGTAVSEAGDIDGDGTPDFLVAAPQMDTNGLVDNGVVFAYSGSTGLEIWRLEGENNRVLLGSSLANAGDVNADGYADMIVGAPKASGNGFAEGGAVTVYSGADGMALYTYGGNSPYSKVGFSVAGAGDVNADGYDDFIFGGYQEDTGGSIDAGTALVYSGKDGQLIYQFNGEADWDWFGFNVSAAGDLNSDGHADIMVAAINTDPNGINSAGSVYVYSGVSGALIHRFDGEDISGWYGWSLCDLGDLDTDGINDIAIGSPWANLRGSNPTGLTQVFSGATGDEIHRWEGQVESGHFGNSISNAKDIDGDGIDDLLVGAKWESPSGDLSGSAYIWSGANGTLLKRIDGGKEQDQLGCSVAGVGDLNGDGLNEVLIGAMGKDPGGQESAGTALVFSLNPFLHPSDSTLPASPASSVQFNLDFPDSEAGANYMVLASRNGIGPSNYGQLTIPLTNDTLFVQMLNGWDPAILQDGRGALDFQGNATAILHGSQSLLPLIGSTLSIAAVTYDPATGIGGKSSIARFITVVP
jgi:hypothetical protein